MTTIACNRRYMVGDKQCTSSDGSTFSIKKVFRRHGDIIGFCGDPYEGMKFVSAYPDYHKLELTEDFEALILTKKGIYVIGKDLIPIEIEDDYCSIGTGSTIALYALKKGYSPIKAVKEAIIGDIYSGNGMVVRNLKIPTKHHL